jgi:zinc protease
LAEGPIEVVVVGDVTVEAAIAETARTFGSLPPRPAPQIAAADMRRTGFPAPNAQPLELLHKGRGDQAIGFLAWPTSDIWADSRRAFATAVLGEVLRNRLTDQLREAEGVTYSPSVGYAHSTVWDGWGYMSASVEVPPEKLPAFFDDVRKIAADLRARRVGDDALARARQPRLENLQRARVTNQYWLNELSGAQADPRRLQLTRDVVPVTAKVSAADLQAAAQLFLRDDKAFRLEVRPQGR